MIPQTSSQLVDRTSITQEMTSYTYAIKDNRISGFIDEKDAIVQTVNLILQTERFVHAIYSWDFGSEFANLYSLDTMLIKARLQSRVEEALLADTRIKSIQDFVVTQNQGNFLIEFTMNTIFGETYYEGVI